MQSTSNATSWKFWLAWLVLVLYLTPSSLLLLHEWYIVGFVADPSVLSKYPFGSEGPAAGAPNYASAEIYSRTAAAGGLASGALLLLAIVSGWRRSHGLLVTCLVCTAAAAAWSVASAA